MGKKFYKEVEITGSARQITIFKKNQLSTNTHTRTRRRTHSLGESEIATNRKGSFLFRANRVSIGLYFWKYIHKAFDILRKFYLICCIILFRKASRIYPQKIFLIIYLNITWACACWHEADWIIPYSSNAKVNNKTLHSKK